MSDRDPDPGTPGPAPLPMPASALFPPHPLPDRRAEYEAFIGPGQAAYYVPRFEAWDQKQPAGRWNGWAALCTQGWMIFRGLYLWGLLWYPLLSLAVLVGCGALWSALSGVTRYPWIVPVAICLAWLVVPGFFGNHLLHRHVVEVIGKSRRLQPMPGAGVGGLDAETARRDWLMRQGVPGWAALLLLFPVFFVGVVGVGAAIAIPAYTDYTVRARVTGALRHAQDVKASYDAYVTRRGQPPATMADLDRAESDAGYGPDVASIRIGQDHAILVTLAGDARLADKTVRLVPTLPGAKPPWACHVGTLAPRYAPSSCRS